MDGDRTIRQLTTGMHVFPRLIADKEKKYVDKTALLYELARDKTDAQLFISRPRRFGKSLMLSTLKAMFECRRELFEGLAIDSLPWEWEKPFPVIDFTMASAKGTTYEEFRQNIRDLVRDLAAAHEAPFREDETTARNFENLIPAVAEKSERKQVVVLIDEYDEPVATFLDDIKTEVEERGIETFLKRNLHALFARIPHEWKIENEKEAKRYFLLFMKLIGADISGERQSANGRADSVLKDKSGVYVFEFKYGRSAKEAVEQARTKDYAGPWLDGNPPVFCVGVNYDPEKRGIDDPLVEPA